ncbi:MAG: polymer-forming cytoskeletal protein [Patescibacteria group bacterium]|nr:polymer-forming cytoskeletal protein [Patescibacteria group bacterium]MDD4610717.1 polymer-forming cytoskeletal protein [Patescibacteria group bacterium]
MKKTKLLIISLFALLLSMPIAASAFEVKTDTAVYVEKNETIDGNLYAAGQTITVDGKVNGDIICAGQSVNINGEVAGDIICAGQSVNINGKIGGSVRVAGNSVNINADIAENLMTVGATINVATESNIGWDMAFAAATTEMRGKIKGSLHGTGAQLIVAGEIGKNINVRLDSSQNKNGSNLIIKNNAKIGGDLTYADCKTCNEATIESGATIGGKTTRNEIKTAPKKEAKNLMMFGLGIGWIFSLFSSLVIGLVLVSLWKKQIIELTDEMFNKIKASIGWGFVIMFLIPILVVIIILTIIGIPLALILLGLWVTAIYMSKILVGIMIGRNLLEKIWVSKKDSIILAMIIGILVAQIIFAVPFIGWILALIAVWWGIGGAWIYYRKN